MELKDILEISISSVVAVLALGTFIKAILEYKKNSNIKRLELFLNMRTRLRQDNDFIEICELLETDDKKLRNIPAIKKDRFTGFFEELAIMRNSGLMNDDVTLYMFGHYAIRCKQSENYWDGLNKNQPLWALFFDFATDMEKAHDKFKFEKSNYHVG